MYEKEVIEIENLIGSQNKWRDKCINLIASENVVSQRGIILSNMEEEYWRKIDRGAFPGSSSNHHLDTLAQMGIATYEMMEFGEQYAEDTIKNARALAAALDSYGFDVQGKGARIH